MAVLDQEQVLNDIISGLYSRLQKLVIRAEQAEEKPPYPFMTLKLTTPFDPERGLPSEVGELVSSEDPGWDEDFQYTRITQDMMVASLTAYSKDESEATGLAQAAAEWFSFSGYEYLKARGIVVVETMAHGNRDTLIVDDYERRVGFDVRLRVASVSKRTLPTFETVGLMKGE